MDSYNGYKDELTAALEQDREYRAEVEQWLSILLRLESNSYQARKDCLIRDPSSISVVMFATKNPARLANYYGYVSTMPFNRWMMKVGIIHAVQAEIIAEVERIENHLDHRYERMLLETLGLKPWGKKRAAYMKQFRKENSEIRLVRAAFRHYAVFTLGATIGLTRITAKQVEQRTKPNPRRYGGKDRTRKPIPVVTIGREALEYAGQNMQVLDTLVEIYPVVRESPIAAMLSR